MRPPPRGRERPRTQGEPAWHLTTPAGLLAAFERILERVKNQPDRSEFTEKEWAAAGKIMNLIEDLCEIGGVRMAESVEELSPAAQKVLRLVGRTVLRLREFYGPLNSRTIAQHLRLAPRTAQAALRELAELGLISFKRHGREMVEIQIAHGIFAGARYERRTPRPPKLSTLSTIRRRKPRSSGERAQNLAFASVPVFSTGGTPAAPMLSGVSASQSLCAVTAGAAAAADPAAAPAAPAGGSPQPPLHGRKETPRSWPSAQAPEGYGQDPGRGADGHGSAEIPNGIHGNGGKESNSPSGRAFTFPMTAAVPVGFIPAAAPPARSRGPDPPE